MKKIILVSLIFSFNVLQAQQLKPCYTTEKYLERLQQDPSIKQRQEQLENYTRQFVSNRPSQRTAGGTVYIIPVVFHVIHNYGVENITDAQVRDAVRCMNEDFRKLNADTINIVPTFQSVAADCEIEFRLATIDPNGNCTNGIDRVASTLTYNAGDQSKLNPWPQNQYLNIWSIHDFGPDGPAAYAYYPGTAPAGADGIICLYNYVGSIGTANLGVSHVLSHEIGHWINLAHVWGSTNNPGVACGDDNVGDTPDTEGWTVCNLNGATCGNVVDNVQNFMEYSYCDNMFTYGQALRMQAALNSSTGGRNNLWTSGNLAATGALASPAPICSPTADFKVNKRRACVNDSVIFSDLSFNGAPTTWSWSFPGGNPATSTLANPVVSYPVAGDYNATLTVSNVSGTDSITKNTVIYVTGSNFNLIPFAESFEQPSSFPGVEGEVYNPDNGNGWNRVSTAAYTGTSCISINNRNGNTDGAIDEFLTGPFDFTNISAPRMVIKIAAAQRDTTHKDKIEIMASYNCGQSWLVRYYRYGNSLNTLGSFQTSSFTPTSLNQWRSDTISFNFFANRPNVRFMIRNTSGRGNNVFIDDINIFGTPTSVYDLVDENFDAEVFPNPSNGNINIRFTDAGQHVSVLLCDETGRIIMNEKSVSTNQDFAVPQTLSPGLYLIKMEIGQRQLIRKVIIAR